MLAKDPKTYDLTVDQVYNMVKLQQQFVCEVDLRWGLIFSGPDHLTLFQFNTRFRVPMQPSMMVPTTAPTPAKADDETLDFSWLK